MSRRVVRPPMTAGRRHLLAALQHTTARELARRVGCSPASVSLWRSGKRTPDYTARVALERELPGCTAPSWDEAADVSNVTPVNVGEPILEEQDERPASAA